MPGGFLGDDFLLGGATARRLYHEVAARAPIVDVHNHLPAAEIAADRTYATLTELWLEGDHYKWRAMRQAGLDEVLITGDADPWDKFAAWAATVPLLVRNPLYIWTHLELRRVFGIEIPLDPGTAPEIWQEANRQLPGWSNRQLLRHFDVEVIATTDDPTSSLDAHTAMAADPGAGLAMIPTMRPDAAHRLLDDPDAWRAWAGALEAVEGTGAVDDLQSMLGALSAAYQRFSNAGARATDTGIRFLPARWRDPAAADGAIRAAARGDRVDGDGRDAAMLEVLALMARLASRDGSVLQLHLGPIRDVSPRLAGGVGRDIGADAVGDWPQGPGLTGLLGSLERDGHLPKVALYNSNPADNTLFATVSGAFSRPGAAPLVQWGPPWWFNDHETGMRRYLDDLSGVGLLACSIGMLTDSRSVLSMTRHEMFRRVLCDVIGRDVDESRIPDDFELLTGIVRGVCVDNARRWFGLPEPAA